ncbi:MAG TPA: hypothetical protein VF761_15625 [Gemmatimonadaceae bacterium]
MLMLAALAAVMVVSLSTETAAPRGHAATDTTSRVSILPVPAAPTPAADLVQPVVVPREHDPSPFDSATTDSAVAGCRDRVASLIGDSSEIVVAETFGDVDPTKGRADSLIIEGTAGTQAFHCAASHRTDGAVAAMKFAVEEGWSGVSPTFAAVHAVSVAAQESCMGRVKKLYPGFVFRGLQLERRGDTVHVSGDAFPLENDIVRAFGCDAIVRGGRIVDAAARRSK